jgi:hypothetical protein
MLLAEYFYRLQLKESQTLACLFVRTLLMKDLTG